eukprot:Nitzschia sp. Nitz4//scaffold104_size75438//26807//29941//NITZ4_005655-RA/size75438-processed-gene-0.43-mRNA-1//-1//CDS//3329532383//1501//frame0
MFTPSIQQALLRASQSQVWLVLKRDQQIATLSTELLILQDLTKRQQAEIQALQSKVREQSETITHKLKAIKSIAMQRAENRRSSLRGSANSGVVSSTATGTGTSAGPSPHSAQTPLRSSLSASVPNPLAQTSSTANTSIGFPNLEAPPRFTERRRSSRRGSTESNYTAGTHSNSSRSNISSSNPSPNTLQQHQQQMQYSGVTQMANNRGSHSSNGTSSSSNSQDIASPPPQPVRQVSTAAASVESQSLVMDPPLTTSYQPLKSDGGPPALPLRQASQDTVSGPATATGHYSTYSDLTDSLISFTAESYDGYDGFEGADHETLATLSTDKANPLGVSERTFDDHTSASLPSQRRARAMMAETSNGGRHDVPNVQPQRLDSQVSASSENYHSQMTLDTNTDEKIMRPSKVEEEEEEDAVAGTSPMESSAGPAPKLSTESKEISFVPLDSEILETTAPPESAPVPLGDIKRELSLHVSDLMPPNYANRGSHSNSNSRSKSMDISFNASNASNPSVRSRRHGSGAQEEIQFDASQAFQDEIVIKLSERRTSVADARFDSSQQLLMEASQAFSTGAMPTPSSVKLRKSLMKSVKKSAGVPNHPLAPGGAAADVEVGSPHSGSKSQRKQIAEIPVTKTKEIEFEAPIKLDPKASMSLLERHLEGNRLGESMHNKTEEEILQEKIFGRTAMASIDDDEDDEDGDEFESYPNDLPVSRGYLEYKSTINLSPVSALTTGSYLKEMSHQSEDENNPEFGPRKALHNAEFVKRLPMEDGFDSEEEDTAVVQDELHGEGESPVKLSVPQLPTLPNGGGGGIADNSTNISAQRPELDFVMSPGMSRPKTSKSNLQDSRKHKPTIMVHEGIVQDMYGDGGTYTGTICVDSRLPHGKGTMLYENERQYEGDWKDGRWHGFGRWTNDNGDCYEGPFVYDARHGRGVYKWKNGNSYQGDFYEDKRQGNGIFQFANGSVYEGEFVNGMFEGRGSFKFDGGSYEGEWKAGVYHGTGLLLFSDGSSYKGDFRAGLAHGNGEETGVDGIVHRGIWENGQPHRAMS